MSAKFSDWASRAVAGVRSLRAYDPGHDLVALSRRDNVPPLVELGSNENLWGPSPKVKTAIADALDQTWRYPDPVGGDLRKALAKHHNVAVEQIILGNGSHELLMQIAQCFAGAGDEAVYSQYCFAVYPIATTAVAASAQVAPALALDASMPRGHDLDALLAQVCSRTKLVYLANPNNPTGTWFAIDALRNFLRGVPSNVLVVVDEAYQEYMDASAESALSLREEFANLIVTRTFSKAYGLAGLRIGFAVAHPTVVDVLNRVRESFNVSQLGLIAAEVALSDQAHIQSVRENTRIEREFLFGELQKRSYKVHNTQTNFLLVDFEKTAAEIETKLLSQSVIVRPMGGYQLGNCLRITVGRRADNIALLAALDK